MKPVKPLNFKLFMCELYLLLLLANVKQRNFSLFICYL